MLTAAILFFGAAILLGLTMLAFAVQGKKIPRTLALIHGPLALTGIILLVVYASSNVPAPFLSLILFIFAALGGATLFYKDVTGKPIPVWFILGHGTLAFIAFVTLIVFTMS